MSSKLIRGLMDLLSDPDSARRLADQIDSGWFVHNTTPTPKNTGRFAQDIEPAGQYITPTSSQADVLPEGLIGGRKQFSNPLIVDAGGSYDEASNWKRILSEKYGATGKELTEAIKKDGYDGIYTVERSPRGAYLGEAVDLNMGKGGKPFDPKYRGSADVGLLSALAGGSGAAVASQQPGLMDFVLGMGGSLMDGLEVPQRGLQGLSRTGYGLLSGESFDQALNKGADVVSQGVDKSAQQFGDHIFNKTQNPEAATAAYLMGLLSSPI